MTTNRRSFKVWYAVSLTLQLGFLIAGPIGGFLLLGWWADRRLQTAPLLLLAGMFIGLAVTAYEVYQLIVPLLKEHDV